MATGTYLAGLTALVGGIALLIGLLTPVAGAMVTLSEIGMALSWLPSLPSNPFEARLVTIFVAVVSGTIILLGPGALSLDARLFGRIRYHSPRTSTSEILSCVNGIPGWQSSRARLPSTLHSGEMTVNKDARRTVRVRRVDQSDSLADLFDHSLPAFGGAYQLLEHQRYNTPMATLI